MTASSLDYAGNLAGTRELSALRQPWAPKSKPNSVMSAGRKAAAPKGDEADTSIDDTSLYTDPQQAADFAEATGVQALAVAFGTGHGVLFEKKPCLDLERLRIIRDKTPVRWSCTRGSGLSADDFQSAIQSGISKINFYTAWPGLSAANRIRQDLQTRPDRRSTISWSCWPSIPSGPMSAKPCSALPAAAKPDQENRRTL